MTLKFILIVDSKFLKNVYLLLLRVSVNNWLFKKLYNPGDKVFILEELLEEMLYMQPNAP